VAEPLARLDGGRWMSKHGGKLAVPRLALNSLQVSHGRDQHAQHARQVSAIDAVFEFNLTMVPTRS
jgi:hypothetical protein